MTGEGHTLGGGWESKAAEQTRVGKMREKDTAGVRGKGNPRRIREGGRCVQTCGGMV